jgi:type IV pilus assembly protein PilB
MKQLGKLLIEEGMLEQAQLDRALEAQKRDGGKLGSTLVKLGMLTEEGLFYFLAVQSEVEFVELQELAAEVVHLITAQVALKYQVLPFKRTDTAFTFITSDPGDPKLLTLGDDLLLDRRLEIRYVVSTESSIQSLLGKYYGSGAAASQNGNGAAPGSDAAPDKSFDTMQDIVEADKVLNAEMLGEGEGEVEAVGGEDDYDENKADDAPVIRLTNSIISSAVSRRCSDIHLNPFEKNLVVRFRIDGNLITQPSPPSKYRRAMIARLKVMGKMDIMEKRKPQDGRIKIKVQGKTIDLRVSTLPTIYGENVVMRILDQENLQLDLNKLGFEPDELEVYLGALRKPYGMILHTGPTGSGKTTTLYSALSTVNDPAKNIMTIEDPVEYNLPGVVQCQVQSDGGLTFPSVLRANLRQDPNVIMIGEIRDGETAEIAVKAALTGHLVLSTLHTNNAPATVMRLVDMGVDRMYVGSSLLCVVAQRLVKRICKDCTQPYTPTEAELVALKMVAKDVEGANIRKGKDCATCGGSGTKGRVALYEIMRMTPNVEEAIYRGDDLNDLTEICIQEGMATLRMLAVKKWLAGMTTLEEILAVTAAD